MDDPRRRNAGTGSGLPSLQVDKPLENRFVSREGRPVFQPDDAGRSVLPYSMTKRLQRNQLRLSDPNRDFDFFGFALSSGAGWVAHAINKRQINMIDAGLTPQGAGFLSNDGTKYGTSDTIDGKDILEYINPATAHLLFTRGFNEKVLKDKTFDEAADGIRYFLYKARLDDELQIEIDGVVDWALGGTLGFGLEILTDPGNIISIGGGTVARRTASSIARKSGQSLLRSQGRDVGLNRVQKFVLQAANRVERNGTIIGGALDNKWAKNHAALLMGAETGTLVAAFDLASQRQEAEIMWRYLDPDAEWYSPTRTVISGLAGTGLGYGLGKLFNNRQLLASDHRRARIMGNQREVAKPDVVGTGSATTPSRQTTGTEFLNRMNELEADGFLLPGEATMLHNIFRGVDDSKLVKDIRVQDRIVVDIETVGGSVENIAELRAKYPNGKIPASGYHTYKDKATGQPAVVLSRNVPEARRTYVLLHEMGHHLLDNPQLRPLFEELFRSGKIDKYLKTAYPKRMSRGGDVGEALADLFAAVAVKQGAKAAPKEITNLVTRITAAMSELLSSIVRSADDKAIKEIEDLVGYLVGFQGAKRPKGFTTVDGKMKYTGGRRLSVDGTPERNRVEGERFFSEFRDTLEPSEVLDDAVESVINQHVRSLPIKVQAEVNSWLSFTPHDRAELAVFMQNRPTAQEIRQFLGVPDKDVVVKALDDITASRKAYADAVVEARTGKTKSPVNSDALTGTPNAPRELTEMEVLIHETRIDRAEAALYLAQNERKIKTTKFRKLVDDLHNTRNEFLDLVERGASAEEVAVAARALNKADNKLVDQTAEITGKFGGRDKEELTAFVDAVDRPRASALEPSRQADILESLFFRGDFTFPMHNPTTTATFLNNRVFSYVAGLGTRRHDAERGAKLSKLYGLAVNTVHLAGMTNATLLPGTESTRSLSSIAAAQRRQVIIHLEKPTINVVKRANGDSAKINTDFKTAMRVAGVGEVTEDPLIAELAFSYRRMMDDFQKQGLSSGVFNSSIDDFMPIVLSNQAVNKHRGQVQSMLTDWWAKTYATKDLNGDVHRGTLIDMEIIKPDGTLNDDFFPEIRDADELALTSVALKIKNRGDLKFFTFADGRNAMDVYDDNVIRVLNNQADIAIHNRTDASTGKQLTAEAKERGDSTRGMPERTNKERKIEQEFWLQQEILDLGVVELNPIIVGSSYVFGTGSRIAKQDAVNRITGRRDIDWEGFLTLVERDLRSELGDSPAAGVQATAFMTLLRDAERDVLGKNIALAEGEQATQFLAANVRNLGGAAINPGIGIAMATVEIPAMLVEMGMKFGVGETARTFIKAATDAKWSNRQLRSIGRSLDFMVREHRHMGQTGFVDDTIAFTLADRLAAPFRLIKDTAQGKRAPQSLRGGSQPALNAVTAATQALADFARLGSFEEFLTNRARAGIAYMHMNQVMTHLDVLQELGAVGTADRRALGDLGDTFTGSRVDVSDPATLKKFKAQARQAGFGGDWRLAMEFVENGMTGENTLLGLALLKQHGIEDLADGHAVSLALTKGTNRMERELMQDAYEKSVDYAVRMVDNIIVNPSVWDRPAHGQHPMLQLINMFLSYPRAFRSNRLRPIADRGMGDMAFWSAFYLGGELMNKEMQAMVFKSASPSERMEAWADDPDEQILRGLGSVPFLGAYQNTILNVYRKATGQATQLNIGGSAGLGVFENMANSLFDLAGAGISPEKEADIKDVHTVEKAIPFLNSVPVRALQSILENTFDD